MSDDDSGKGFILDKPHQIKMFGLLAARGRLHIEMSGLKFRQSTLTALQNAGITKARTKAKALVDLNAYIESLGGPPDNHRTTKEEA